MAQVQTSVPIINKEKNTLSVLKNYSRSKYTTVLLSTVVHWYIQDRYTCFVFNRSLIGQSSKDDLLLKKKKDPPTSSGG
jgi:hypothetical protein